MGRPVHFEIHAEQPERAAAFYGTLFGWSFQKWDGPMPYWLISTGDAPVGINGGMVQRHGGAPTEGQPVNAYVITVDVESCDGAVELALAHGGSVALPKMPIPGIGWLAYLKDTEGNIFGVMQRDEKVA